MQTDLITKVYFNEHLTHSCVGMPQGFQALLSSYFTYQRLCAQENTNSRTDHYVSSLLIHVLIIMFLCTYSSTYNYVSSVLIHVLIIMFLLYIGTSKWKIYSWTKTVISK